MKHLKSLTYSSKPILSEIFTEDFLSHLTSKGISHSIKDGSAHIVEELMQYGFREGLLSPDEEFVIEYPPIGDKGLEATSEPQSYPQPYYEGDFRDMNQLIVNHLLGKYPYQIGYLRMLTWK